MNEVIRALKERRSIRSYRTEQVREEDLQQILEAATYAPSGMGAQPVILVRSRTRRPLPACLS